MQHGFTWLGLIPALHEHHEYLPLSGAVLVMLIIFITSIIAVRRTYDSRTLAPEEKISFFTLYDIGFKKLWDMMRDGNPHGERYMPILATSFIFIFVSNLLGVIPGFLPPTSDLHTNAACAIVVFLATHYFGIKEHGFGYIKQFMGPVLGLVILMLPIELVSHIARPLSLTLRLYGNINGDHIVVQQFGDLVPLVVPVIFMALGVWVAFLQAFIFTMISLVYFNLATSHDH